MTTPDHEGRNRAVFPTVAETMADALGCDSRTSSPTTSLIEDLDAESIDFLDMVFRLERAFKIKIPRGKIVENARGALSEAEFESGGIVTEAGIAQLRAYLSGDPGRPLQDADEGQDIPRLFTPFKLVITAQREMQAPRSPCSLPPGAQPGAAGVAGSAR